MYVLVLASQKGGAGKTTLSRHLAVEAERAGEGPVVLIDADPQGGLAGWWNRRQAESPVFFASRLEDLPKHIKQARAGGFKLVIIDTPPQATSLIGAVVRLGRPRPYPDASIPRRPRCRWAHDRHRGRGRQTHDLRDQRSHKECADHGPGRDCTVAKRNGCHSHDPPFGFFSDLRDRRPNRERTGWRKQLGQGSCGAMEIRICSLT